MPALSLFNLFLRAWTPSCQSSVTAPQVKPPHPRQDNLIFARIKEDRDFDFNKNRENRFTISGFRVSTVPPADPKARKEFFRELVEKLVHEATPDLDPPAKVTDVYVNMRYGRGPPFIEGKMDSVTNSISFRIAAHNLIKEEHPSFIGLFVANSVTLATRVRIEILRAVADTLQSDVIKAYVQPFTSRPILHVQMRDPLARVVEGANRSYNFVEAVSRWGDQVSQAGLIPAYRKARPAFVGALEQYSPIRGRGGRISDSRHPAPAHPLFRGAGGSYRGRGIRSVRSYSQAAVRGRGRDPASKRRHSEDQTGTGTPTKRPSQLATDTQDIYSDAME